MKVLYITGLFPTPELPIRGMFIQKRLEYLLKAGISFDVICPYFIETGFELTIRKLFSNTTKEYTVEKINGFTYNYIPVKIDFLKKKFKLNFICQMMADEIIGKINISDYDVIHTQWLYPQGCAAYLIKTKTNLPLVITTQGSDIHTIPFKNNKLKKICSQTLNNADKLIFVSNYLLKKAREIGYNKQNYEIINNGVDTKIFYDINKRLVREKLKLPINLKIAGFIGNLVYVKRADKLPEIFKNIKELDENILFVIIGLGKYKKCIQKKCLSLNINTIFFNELNHNEISL